MGQNFLFTRDGGELVVLVGEWSVGQSFSPLGEKIKRELVRLMDSVGELQKQQTGTNGKEWTGWWLVSVE